MKSKQTKAKPGYARRTVLKQVVSGVVVAGSAASLPEGWVKPIVDAVLLPAHAQTSSVIIICPVCDVTLSIVNRDIPVACSGSVFPPITLELEVSVGCSDIELLGFTHTLPAPASYIASPDTGAVISSGSTITISINNYPSTDPFTCAATDPGSIIIEYTCVDFDGASEYFEIDVLREILTA